MTGPNAFATQPRHADHALLDGTRLDGDFRHTRSKLPGGGVSRFQKWDGSTDLQIALTAVTLPINMQAYQWTFEQRAVDEDEWNLLDAIDAGARTAYWVPYSTVTDVFTLSAGANSLTLSRDRASEVITGFESNLYVSTATLDGVSQTIVTGTPLSGEVQLTGDRSVVTPSAAGGERLEIRYYPAHIISVYLGEETLNDYNDLVRSVELLEARSVS